MILNKNYYIEGKFIKEKASIQLIEKVHKYDYLYIDMNQLLSYEENEEFHKFQTNLPEDYLYTEPNEDYGIERNHHITSFYGLLPNNDYQYKLIKMFIQKEIDDFSLVIKGLSFFRHENSPFDVMKFDIESEALNKIFHFILNNFDNECTYTEYKPHMTVAYIKKGYFNDNQYEGKNDFSFCNKIYDLKEIIYQDTYDNKKVIYI